MHGSGGIAEKMKKKLPVLCDSMVAGLKNQPSSNLGARKTNFLQLL